MTYEYACEACGHQWEAEQSIKDAPLKTCVACGTNKAKRLVSGGTGFLLKGGGWYADGYGSKAASAASSPGEAPAAKSSGEGAGGAGNSDTKSEGAAKSPASSDSTPSKPAEASPKASSAPSTQSAKAS